MALVTQNNHLMPNLERKAASHGLTTGAVSAPQNIITITITIAIIVHLPHKMICCSLMLTHACHYVSNVHETLILPLLDAKCPKLCACHRV